MNLLFFLPYYLKIQCLSLNDLRLISCRLQGEQTGTAVPAPFGLYASTPKKCLVKDK